MFYKLDLVRKHFIGLPDNLTDLEAEIFYKKILTLHANRFLKPNQSGRTTAQLGKLPGYEVFHYGVLWGNLETNKFSLNSRRLPVLSALSEASCKQQGWWTTCREIVGDEVCPMNQIKLLCKHIFSFRPNDPALGRYRQAMTFYWCHVLATPEVPFVYVRWSADEPDGTVYPFTFTALENN